MRISIYLYEIGAELVGKKLGERVLTQKLRLVIIDFIANIA